MKKILALLISLIMIFTLVACNDTEDSDNSRNRGGSSSDNGSEGENTPRVNIYKNSPHASDWDSSKHNDWAQGVWDSYVLPDFFPGQPQEGLVGDIQTSYTGKHHERWSAGVADIYNENPFESYGLTFYGQDEHLAYLIDALEDEGFTVKKLNVMGEDQYQALQDEWYVHIRSFNSDAEDGCVRFFDITIVPDQMKMPAVFEGVPLPQFGYAFFEPEYGNEEYEEYTLYTAPTGQWFSQIELEAVTPENLDSYKQTLISAGFNETSGANRYEKNGLYVVISYYAENTALTLYIASNEYMTNYWY